jgi:ArsR family transcriptional regulator
MHFFCFFQLIDYLKPIGYNNTYEVYKMNEEIFLLQLKALSDPTRWEIINKLTENTLCACQILSDLAITQPTLSHHMKVLCDSNLVISTRSGNWNHYTLNTESFRQLSLFFGSISLKEISKACENTKCVTDTSK